VSAGSKGEWKSRVRGLSLEGGSLQRRRGNWGKKQISSGKKKRSTSQDSDQKIKKAGGRLYHQKRGCADALTGGGNPTFYPKAEIGRKKKKEGEVTEVSKKGFPLEKKVEGLRCQKGDGT